MLPDQQDGFEPDEIDLVNRTCNGDRAAAERLFIVVLGPTLAAISRYWRCEDLPDELFVHLSENNWRRLRTWSGKADLKSWVRIVARRLSVQMVKGWTRSISLSDGEDRDLADGHDSVLDRLIESERGMELLNAIERLESARDQAVLRMYYFDSKSPSFIASKLACPIDRVYVIKTRAVKRLQHLLERAATDVDAS